ncbi:DUF6114 domain-containing protein [Gordonia hirsuta]|uniref:DUF6114 domain-containing protein n=1 Tax=Gordonia hirsuta TaxID=53427 RepID=UPI000345317A|nr:DUF6114 domain-containing protein [Gordonia hirsuta]
MKEKFATFRRWKVGRPFGGAVCLLLSAILLALPSVNNLRIGDLILTVSTVSGVSTVMLSVLMALCGIAALVWLHTRVIAGISAMVIALVAFPAANFGGFIVGTLLGVVGAALVLAWRPLPDDAGANDDAGSSGDAVAVADGGVVDSGGTAESGSVVEEETTETVVLPGPDTGVSEAVTETMVVVQEPADGASAAEQDAPADGAAAHNVVAEDSAADQGAGDQSAAADEGDPADGTPAG